LKRVLFVVVLLFLGITPALAAFPPALGQDTPQEKIVDDDSDLPRAHRRQNHPDLVFTEDGESGTKNSRRTVELAVGLFAMVSLLIFALLRWQARASRRR